MIKMFFSLPYQYPPAGLFSRWHLLLLSVTACLIAAGLWLSRNMMPMAVRRTVRIVTACLWGLELVKILFVLFVTGSKNPNEFVPLYYCSITLYAGLLSSLGSPLLMRVGDAFIAMGGIVGGAVFLLMPTTSLPQYPAFHFISWHSFLLHGTMVYLGLLLLVRRVYCPRLGDIRYVAGLTGAIAAIAWLFNTVYNHIARDPVANLMFISRDFAGTPISILYRLCGRFFTPVMCLGQAFLPFFLMYGGILLVNEVRQHLCRTAKSSERCMVKNREK